MAVIAVLIIFLTSCEDDNEPTNIVIIWGDGVTDIDGNRYKSVIIGDQEWMAENLITTTYNDSIPITLEEDNTTWSNLTTGAYCWWHNNEAAHYGILYNWYTIETSILCPDGWHIPSDEEWTALEDYLTNNGHEGTEGTALKATKWWAWGGNGTDDYGFTALPGGYRTPQGGFEAYEYQGYWWSSTEYSIGYAWYRNMYYDVSYKHKGYYKKEGGFSVRCIKDE